MCAYASVHVCIQVTMSLVRFKRDHEGKTSEKLKSTPLKVALTGGGANVGLQL